jgi:predicted cupin superfamily sugar epimerase
MTMTAEDIIAALELVPHPEGGHYVQTFRDLRAEDQRPHSTAIYFLLRAGEQSRWHRVDAAEVWHFYAGAPLVLEIVGDDGSVQRITLGPAILEGQRPQAVVPVGAWQSARTTGEWTLVGCTVAPGFEFSGFEMAPQGWEPLR